MRKISASSNIVAALAVLSAQFLLPVAHADGEIDVAGLKACGSIYGSTMATKTLQMPLKDSEVEVEIGQSIIYTYNISIMNGVESKKFAFDKEIKFSGSALGAKFDVVVQPSSTVLSEKQTKYNPIEYTFKYEKDASPSEGFFKQALHIYLDLPSGNVYAKASSFSDPIKIGLASITTSEKCLKRSVGSFRKELIYSGISNGSISVLYREFYDDMARPAFSQDLRYDLKDGDEIGYKGSRFKVIKASNTGLKYKVLKSLD